MKQHRRDAVKGDLVAAIDGSSAELLGITRGKAYEVAEVVGSVYLCEQAGGCTPYCSHSALGRADGATECHISVRDLSTGKLVTKYDYLQPCYFSVAYVLFCDSDGKPLNPQPLDGD